jgi:hypothetical protein
MPDPVDLTGEDPEQTLRRIIDLGFGRDRDRYRRFLELLRDEVPPDVTVILRGSAVAGERWADGAPFDADGPGSSDLDLTFVGGSMLKFFEKFYIPGLHTAPLCDEDIEVAPELVPLRDKLCRLAGRPVNIQATSDLVQYVRDVTMRQPYYVLIERQPEVSGDTADATGAPPVVHGRTDAASPGMQPVDE